jgi:TetR/AcrR family fatty acid metabolism transcriptional regulator
LRKNGLEVDVMEELPLLAWEPEKGKREAILASAFEIFNEKGFHNTKIEEIAQRAGVGKGTVYLYFSSKEDLLREMMKEVVLHKLSVIRQRMAAAASPRERLYALFRTHFEFLRRNRNMVYLSSRDFGFVDDELEQWLHQQKRAFLDELQRLVEAGMACGQFRSMDARLAAALLFSALGVVIADEQLLHKDKLDEVMNLLERGFLAETSS